MKYHTDSSLPTTKGQKLNVIEDTEKKKPLYIVGSNINWYRPLGEKVYQFLKIWETELSIDLVISLLNMQVNEYKMSMPKDISMLSCLLQHYSQSKCPSKDESINK